MGLQWDLNEMFMDFNGISIGFSWSPMAFQWDFNEIFMGFERDISDSHAMFIACDFHAMFMWFDGDYTDD